MKKGHLGELLISVFFSSWAAITLMYILLGSGVTWADVIHMPFIVFTTYVLIEIWTGEI